MTDVVLFRKPNCVACDALVEVMKMYGIPYLDQPLGSIKVGDKDYSDLLPVLVVDGKLVENPIESPVLTRLMLENNIIHLEYTKKAGPDLVRVARATLKEEFIPKEHRAKEPGDMFSEQIRYYDLNVNGWRSFIHDNLIVMSPADNPK